MLAEDVCSTIAPGSNSTSVPNVAKHCQNISAGSVATPSARSVSLWTMLRVVVVITSPSSYGLGISHSSRIPQPPLSITETFTLDRSRYDFHNNYQRFIIFDAVCINYSFLIIQSSSCLFQQHKTQVGSSAAQYLAKALSPWHEFEDESGIVLYYHLATRETRRDKPLAPVNEQLLTSTAGGLVAGWASS